jgi:hypothetical protein
MGTFPRGRLYEFQQPGGPRMLCDIQETPGDIFFVDSATGVSGGGRSPDAPALTLAAALALATADQGDVIYVAEHHNENIGDAQITINKAGVTIVFLGHMGARFDFDHANASIDITASRVRLLGRVRLLPSVTAVAIGIDVNAAATDVLLANVEVLPGEDGAGVDEFALAIDVKAGCDRFRIGKLKIRQHASAAGCVAGLRFTGASDDLEIDDLDIVLTGAAAVAPLNNVTAAITNLRVRKALLVSDDEPGVELHASATGVLENVRVFSDLATIAAAIVAAACARFNCQYVEVAPEREVAIGTASADD